MRALLHERIALRPNSSISSSTIRPSVTMLLFGCRSQSDDYLYEKEWLECALRVGGIDSGSGSGSGSKVVLNCTSAETEEVLPPYEFPAIVDASGAGAHTGNGGKMVVVTAFSRKGRNAGTRVTHSLRTHQEAVWSLLKQVRVRLEVNRLPS
jgi:hypothetical protein